MAPTHWQNSDGSGGLQNQSNSMIRLYLRASAFICGSNFSFTAMAEQDA